MACADPTISVESPPFLVREEMVPYKHMQNLAELPLGSTHTVTAYIDHYGHQKLVVKLGDGITYQGGEHLERQKEQLTKMCKIVISKTKLLPTRQNFAVCKVVQKGNWTGLLDYEKVSLLPANKKRNAVKVLDVRSVEHKGQKRSCQRRIEQYTKSNDRSWRTM